MAEVLAEDSWKHGSNMMHRELEDYVDDIVVKSKRREDHAQILRKVFERCQASKLRMNPLKCAFGISSGEFLGFLVHSRGIDVDPAKATVIATMKPPVTVKELKSFLGKVSYIRRLIPGLASITLAFARLLKKGQNFEWGRNIADSLQKVTTNYDEPSYSASSDPQKATTTPLGHQIVCHRRVDCLRRWKRC